MTDPVEPVISRTGPRASFGNRLVAAIIDGVVTLVAQGVLILVLRGLGYFLSILLSIGYYIYLEGSTLDFATTLMARGFKWINPNAKGTCGCGESVQF